MINLPGFEVKEEMVRGYNSTIYRGIREMDTIPIIIKLMNKEYPTVKEISSFLREYEIAKNLKGDGIVEVYALERYKNGFSIIMEDFGGASIDRIVRKTSLGLMEKISLAIKMTSAIITTHQQNVIHKDVNLSNFVWNTATGIVKIIDFGISTELPREASHFDNLNIIEGTINYLSPEQTGRIGRSVDYRTDLYSLGVTLYELLTGQVPFSGCDEAEIVYRHLARSPTPPIEINPDLPPVISEIVLKLMAKNAEDRYQSATGLKKDLERCLCSLETTNNVERFIIGQNDISERFQIPQKLYGREQELKNVIDSFENITQGNAEFILISGYSGIGKSSLINEVRNPITAKRGYFASGKFGQLEKSVPYFGITRAFSGLVYQLLGESQKNLERWKQCFTEAMGLNAQLMVDLIPALEQIIGPQPPVPELKPVEAQNRFNMTFCEFLKVFAKKEHPLVLFIDDLQWSDGATLDLLTYLLSAGDARYIMFIGSYRENEVTSDHPLRQLLEAVKTAQKSSSVRYREIVIEPLNISDTNKMIAGTFCCDPEETRLLTEIIYKKTKGNPFFTNQVLSSLYQQGSFSFVAEKGKWEWDIKRVEAVEISDQVIDVLVKRLELLPPAAISILKLASCVGNQFDMAILSRISGESPHTIGNCLWVAIEKEIVYPINSNYRYMKLQPKEIDITGIDMVFRFNHDRIRQAVYSLVAPEEKPAVHLKIGREFQKMHNQSTRREPLFDIVNHLNLGRTLLQSKEERIELSDLNVRAGNYAKNTTAFAVAASYYETGRSLLSEEEWNTLPDALYNLSIELAMVSVLSGEFQRASLIGDNLSAMNLTKLQRGAVANVTVLRLEFEAKLLDAIDEIRKSLLMFDIRLPDNPQEIGQKIHEGIGKLQQFIARTPIDKMVELPEMTDPDKVMAMQLLFQSVPPALLTDPPLFICATLMMFELTATYGTTPLSCKCLVDCGIILGSTLNDYKTSYQFGEAAFALLDKFKADALKPSVYFSFTYSSYWRKHFRESIEYYDLSYRTGLETGDIQHTAYAIVHKLHLFMYTGKNLTDCKTFTENTIKVLSRLKTAVPLHLAEIVDYIIQKFQSTPIEGDEAVFEAKDYEMIAAIEDIKNLTFLGRFFHYNTYLHIIMDQYERAEKWRAMSEKILFAFLSDFPVPDYYLFHGLILVDKFNSAEINEQNTIRETLLTIQEKLKNWSDNCPSNFAHKYFLLTAEIAIIEKKPLEIIIDLFNKTTDSIGDDDFIQMKALCNELQGKFWLQRGNETIGKTFIRDAYYLYNQWGAHRKVALMEKKYVHFLGVSDESYKKTGTSKTTTSVSVDTKSILKSTQAISGEIKKEKLLTVLIRTIIENAGAQHGCFLLKNESDNEFYIEAMMARSSETIQVMQSQPYYSSSGLCPQIVQYVIRTQENVVLNSACTEGSFQNSSYIQENMVKSVLCMPVIYQNRLKGIVYLENNLAEKVFTHERLEVLNILASQASISIENAILYHNMEEKIQERTLQLKNANDKLKELSLHDPLTKLHNRRYTYEYVSEFAAKFINNKVRSIGNRDKREYSPKNNILGVFIVDIDHFKEVNDNYGHQAGDSVLVTLSNELKSIIRADDIIVRWGGEEFLIVLNNTKPNYLKSFAEKVLHRIKATPILLPNGKTINKTCSMGFVEMPIDESNAQLLTFEQMINFSDYALYCAKRNGRNCAAHFKIAQPHKSAADLKERLIDFSKNTEMRSDYFKIDYYK